MNASVLVLRWDRVRHQHFRAPAIIPILGSITCRVLLTQQDAGTWLRAGILILIGLGLYALNVVYRRSAGDGAQKPRNGRAGSNKKPV